ncbi:MAG: phosphoenolpyruvate--protein phosphotransferase [Phycisphaerales bacterium JB040]
MQSLQGIPVSEGLVVGTAVILPALGKSRKVRDRSIEPDHIDDEIRRFDEARLAAIDQLSALHAEAHDEMGAEAAKIFLFHMGALADHAILDPIRYAITNELSAAEPAVARTFDALAAKFSVHADTTFRSKVSDLEDLKSRLLDHLAGRVQGELPELPDRAVIIADDLTPSQTAAFDRSKVIAFVTDLGGKTSHTAIVARALGLPAVVGCRNATTTVSEGDPIIVDGRTGNVTIDPDARAFEKLRQQQARNQAYKLSLRDLSTVPAKTSDGVTIHLQGNIEFPDEAHQVLEAGGKGVGLYRTEFLFLTSEHEPTEEDHYNAYAQCIRNLEGHPLTIRTVDLGADKYTQQRAEIPERNPFLGLRSIRYCLQNVPMFKTQLRAILRASALGPVKVMFPLITSVSEFRQGKMLLHDAMEDLDDKGLPYDRSIEVGMMVEVPSAALQAPTFAKEVDFFSIGTNDLVQYTLAVDRTNERVASLYNPAHPAVLRLVRDVSRAASRYNIPVSCCGESAADPEFAALLIGLGLRTLSVTASSIPPLKRMIRSISADQCERIARKAISFDSDAESQAYVRDRIQKLIPDAYDGRSVD